MYLAKHVGRWSLPAIGRFFNGRHHTTVLHAIKKVERLRKTDEAFDSLLDILTRTLTADASNYSPDVGISLKHPGRSGGVELRSSSILKELPMYFGIKAD